MRYQEVVWAVGRPTLGGIMRLASRYRDYGTDRLPLAGGVVLAVNHFSWIDVVAFGARAPRPIWYMAKAEAHAIPVFGQILRGFGSFAVRRGESDREAIRYAREIVRTGRMLGLFVEGTRQRTGVPGPVQPGAAMIAIQEGVPVLPGAVHGSTDWRLGTFQPISVAWGKPMRLDGVPRNARGYREGAAEIGQRIRHLWEWLGELDRMGRPHVAVPPL